MRITSPRLPASAISPFAARKGEEYLLDRRLAGIVKRIIFPCPTPVSKGILVIPTYDGTIMVGPTAESIEDREDLTHHTGGRGDRLHGGAAARSRHQRTRLHRGVRRGAGGCRQRGLHHRTDAARRASSTCAGIQSPGLTAAPAIARLVCDMLRDEGLPLAPKADFGIRLRQAGALRVADARRSRSHLAQRDRRYGRMACRCEYVTEGEVLDAIQRGAHTLDGIKFRTRAGMGRCQGGFCTSRCMELLAHELNVPLHRRYQTRRRLVGRLCDAMTRRRP